MPFVWINIAWAGALLGALFYFEGSWPRAFLFNIGFALLLVAACEAYFRCARRHSTISGQVTGGLYLTDEKVFASRRLEPKAGGPGLFGSGFCLCFRGFLCARRPLAIANASPDAVVGVSNCRIVSFHWDSETGLVASLEQILDEAGLAYGAHRQSGDYRGAVLRSCDSHCAPVPDIGKRSVAPIAQSRGAELLD